MPWTASPFTSAQLLFCFALLTGHLLAAAVLQLFALVVVRGHFKQPAALYLDHLSATEDRRRVEVNRWTDTQPCLKLNIVLKH